jgi:hypothetical protein
MIQNPSLRSRSISLAQPFVEKRTICQWVEGQYEDKLFTGATCIESLVIPDWALTVKQVFNSANPPESAGE